MQEPKFQLNLQVQQVIDGVLLSIALWVSYRLGSRWAGWFAAGASIPPFSEYQWMLFVIMPFGPIMLELQGYYADPLQKTPFTLLAQISRAGILLSAIFFFFTIYFRRQVPSKPVLLILTVLAILVLLLRERLRVAYLKSRAG